MDGDALYIAIKCVGGENLEDKIMNSFKKDLLNSEYFYNVWVEMCRKNLNCLGGNWGHRNTFVFHMHVWVRIPSKGEETDIQKD